MNPSGDTLKYAGLVVPVRSGIGPVAQLGRPRGTPAGPRKSIWLLTSWSGVRTSRPALHAEPLRASPRARSAPPPGGR